ncbi:hypothetical protein C9994_06165 [Marivirga lumbricoides]|uniref:Uncharacterized protein n=2 Tax=Marivirga lumbricoides TaxID=1046115 RepID=A0A2T4DSH4_9BACT|nr:hypothetical protein C9994_06165 [Marivirga lumbricoides]
MVKYSINTLILRQIDFMERIARAFLAFTGFGYVVLLFYAYAYFADETVVRLNLDSEVYKFSNNTLFYTGLVIPAVIIIVCYSLGNLIKKQSVSSNSYFKNEKAQRSLYSWSVSLAGAFNLFFSALLTAIIFTNNQEGFQQNGYIPLLVGSLVIILFWIIWLPLILRKNK